MNSANKTPNIKFDFGVDFAELKKSMQKLTEAFNKISIKLSDTYDPLFDKFLLMKQRKFPLKELWFTNHDGIRRALIKKFEKLGAKFNRFNSNLKLENSTVFVLYVNDGNLNLSYRIIEDYEYNIYVDGKILDKPSGSYSKRITGKWVWSK